MTALTSFPARIRFVNADGTLSPEALRMLGTLVARTGGAVGDTGIDTFAAPTPADTPLGFPDIVAPAGIGGDLLPVDLQPASLGASLEATFQGGSECGARADELIVQPASAASPIVAVTATASPMPYVARDAGTLVVVGGTVSAIALARGAASVPLGLIAGLISLSAGDKVTITYTAAPTLTFIPR